LRAENSILLSKLFDSGFLFSIDIGPGPGQLLPHKLAWTEQACKRVWISTFIAEHIIQNEKLLTV
jgi:hypothetical protein